MSASSVIRRLEEIKTNSPWLLPAAVAAAMVQHPDVPIKYFAGFLGAPSPRVSDATLRNLAKLTSLGGLSPSELRAYINLRFHALTFEVLTEAQVNDLLGAFQPLGAVIGPRRFAEHVRDSLQTGAVRP